MRKSWLLVFRTSRPLTFLLLLLTGCGYSGQIAIPQPDPQPTVVARFALVASQDNTISTFAIDAATGTLHSVGTAISGGSAPISLAVDPAGRLAYVANFIAGGITAFSIDGNTGTLTPVGSLVHADDGPALSPCIPTDASSVSPIILRTTCSRMPSIPTPEH